MHVEPEHVADAVERVAAVEEVIRIERLVERRLENSEIDQPLREHAHRAPVRLEKVVPGDDGLDAGALRFPDEIVDRPLLGREASGDRQRARDVGGVERVALDAGVEQKQLARRASVPSLRVQCSVHACSAAAAIVR